MAKASEAKMKYIRKWKNENVIVMRFECNKAEDADVIAHLEGMADRGISKTAYIKALIRADMKSD